MSLTSRKFDKTAISLEICKRLGIDTQGKDSGNILVPCFSHREKEGSLSISLDKGIYHCFGCGISGTLANRYYEVFKRSIYKDLDIEVSPIQIEKQINFDETPETDFILEGKTYCVSSTDKGRDFLAIRGLTEKVLNDARATFCYKGTVKKRTDTSNKKEWVYIKDRIIIPIYEKQKVLSLEMRDIYGEKQYLQSFKDPSKAPAYKKVLYPKHSSVNTLYDLDQLDISKPLYLTEGLMDVLSLRTNNNFKNSTCLFRNMPSERQLYLLRNFEEVIYIVNNDLPGLKGCLSFFERFQNKKAYLCPPKGVKDINDILQGKHKKYKTIEDLIDVQWEHTKIYDVDSLKARIELEENNEKIRNFRFGIR